MSFDREGRDFAIDGLYETVGDSAREKWIFQFKYRTDTDDLLKSIPQEVNTIRAHRADGRRGQRLWGGATHYRLLTSCKLLPQNRQSAQEQLAALGLDADIWFRESLAGMVTEHPFLLEYFFGSGHPILYPLNEALAYYERSPLIGEYYSSARLPFVPVDGAAEAFRAFVSDPALSVLEATGPPGVGKTRQLIEFALGVEDETGWHPLFASPYETTLLEHVGELPLTGSYVIFVDEPQRYSYLQDMCRLTLLQPRYAGRFKFVLAMYPSAVRDTRLALGDCYSVESCEKLEIPPSIERVNRLLVGIGVDEDVAEQTAEVSRGLPVWAVLAAREYMQDDEVDVVSSQEELADRYVVRFAGVVSDRLHGDIELAQHALGVVAALQPVNMADAAVVQALASLADVAPHKAAQALQAVLASGIVMTYGRLSAIMPDVLADRVLFSVLCGSVGAPTGVHEQFISALMGVGAQNLFRNMARAEASTGTRLLDEVLAGATAEAVEANNIERRSTLRTLGGAAPYRPVEYLLLCKAMLDAPQPDMKYEDRFFGPIDGWVITNADVIAEMKGNLLDCRYVLAAIRPLMEIIAALPIQPGVDPGRLMEDAVSIIRQVAEYEVGKQMDYYEQGLTIAEEWVQRGGAEPGAAVRLHLALAVARRLLHPEFDETRFKASTSSVQWQQHLARPTEPMVRLWERASELAKSIATSGSEKLAEDAVDVLADALRAVDRIDPTDEDEAAWAAEAGRRFDVVAELVEAELPWPARNKLEDGVALRVTHGEGRQQAEARAVIEGLEADREYHLYRELAGTAAWRSFDERGPELGSLVEGLGMEYLAALLAEIAELTRDRRDGRILVLLRDVALAAPADGVWLYEAIVKDDGRLDVLQHYVSALLAALRAGRPEYALTQAEALASSADRRKNGMLAQAYALMAQLCPDVSLDQRDINVLQTLMAAGETVPEVQAAILEALPLFYEVDEDFYETTLMDIAGTAICQQTATPLLHAACLGSAWRTSIEGRPIVKRVLAAFAPVPDLAALGQTAFSELAHLLSQVTRADPLWGAQFWVDRMDLATELDGFEPIPYSIDRCLKDIDREHDRYADALRAVRDGVLETGVLFAGVRLFHAFSGGGRLDAGSTQVLSELLQTASFDGIWAAALFLREFPVDELFAEVAADIAGASRDALAPAEHDKVLRELVCSAASCGVQMLTPGAPPPNAASMKHEFSQLRLRRVSPGVEELVDRMLQDADRQIKSNELDDEERRFW